MLFVGEKKVNVDFFPQHNDVVKSSKRGYETDPLGFIVSGDCLKNTWQHALIFSKIKFLIVLY